MHIYLISVDLFRRARVKTIDKIHAVLLPLPLPYLFISFMPYYVGIALYFLRLLL